MISRSTRSTDLVLKRALYEEMGVGSYWVLDPVVPSLRAWDLVDGRYIEVAEVCGAQPYLAERPFPVRVVSTELVPAAG